MARFRLSSSDKDFNSRVNGLFSCLDEVATVLPDDGLVFDSSAGKRTHRDAVEEEVQAPSHGSLTGYRSPHTLDVSSGSFTTPGDVSEGSFITPTYRNIPNKRFKAKHTSRPGYVICPDKWTCYSMEDTEVMNDAQNKKAALQLLSDLKQKKASNSENNEEDEDTGKIVFKKPTHKQSVQEDEAMDVPEEPGTSKDMSGDFGGTKKIMMEEYVVGTKKKGKKKKSSKISSESKKNVSEVKLSYLAFEDDSCE